MLDASTLSTLLRYDAEAERERLRGDLAYFTREAWRIVDPLRQLVWGWHIDCILAHIEAVARGEIRTLLVNIPPRHAKSSILSVIAPAWLWARDPSLKMLTGSYAMPLATRDATRTRRLITSSWYTERFPEVKLQPDQREKTRYDLVTGGARYCFSTNGTVTGEGGNLVLWDDPHKAKDMYSDPALQEAVDFWSETLPSRLDDPEKAAKIVIMQRLGPKDMTGYIMAEAAKENDPNVVHVCLPAHFDPNRASKTRWFRDPRTEKGELLWPQRFTARALHLVTKDMTPQAVAAQMDQLPHESGGSIFKRKWWQVWNEPKLPPMSRILVSFDPANKKTDQGSRWACTVWGWWRPEPEDKFNLVKRQHSADEGGNLMLLDAWAEHMDYPGAKKRLMDTVKKWEDLSGEPPDYVLIEDKAAGPSLIVELTNAGIEGVMGYNPGKDDKVARANLVSDLLYHGRIWVHTKKLKDGSRLQADLPLWAEEVVRELEQFPTGTYDDLTDTTTQAWHFSRDLGRLSIETDAPLVEPERETTIRAGYYA